MLLNFSQNVKERRQQISQRNLENYALVLEKKKYLVCFEIEE